MLLFVFVPLLFTFDLLDFILSFPLLSLAFHLSFSFHYSGPDWTAVVCCFLKGSCPISTASIGVSSVILSPENFSVQKSNLSKFEINFKENIFFLSLKCQVYAKSPSGNQSRSEKHFKNYHSI